MFLTPRLRSWACVRMGLAAASFACPLSMSPAGFLIVSVCAGAPFAVPGTTVVKADVPDAIGPMIVSAAFSVVLAPLFSGAIR